MADTPQATTEDDIYDEGAFVDDGTDALLRSMLDEMGDPEEDKGGLDQPIEDMPTVDAETVSAEEGAELISDAELGKTKTKPKKEEAKAEEPTEEEGDEPAPQKAKKEDATDNKTAAKDDDDADAGPEEEGKPDDLAASDLKSLLDGVDETRAKELTRRVTQADGILKQFEGQDAAMRTAGAKDPEGAVRGLLYLHNFAQTKPDEYLPWVAQQVTGGDETKLRDLFGKAAERFGLKLADPDSDDDDLFEDEETKAVLEENKRLKAQLAGNAPDFGPFTPERVQQSTIQSTVQNFINEVDETGQPKRPYLNHVLPMIAQRAQQQTQTTGKPPSIEDLDGFYAAEVEKMRSTFAPAPQPGGDNNGSAATPGQSMQDQIKKTAAAAAKAKRASKSVDGTGQGASRRPSKIAKDAPLDQVIGQFWSDLSE